MNISGMCVDRGVALSISNLDSVMVVFVGIIFRAVFFLLRNESPENRVKKEVDGKSIHSYQVNITKITEL